jgi:hypothetical protein
MPRVNNQEPKAEGERVRVEGQESTVKGPASRGKFIINLARGCRACECACV